MSFELEQVDRGISYALKKEVIRLGYWPDDIGDFIPNNNQAGFDLAKQTIIDSGKSLLKVFGTGNYKDRKQLKTNNVIVNRIDIEKGSVGYSAPLRYEEYEIGGVTKFRKISTAEGTKNILYEIRFVCDDIALDRIISKIMMFVFDDRSYLKGIDKVGNNLTETPDGFWVMKNGSSKDLSGKGFIERVYRYVVTDIEINRDRIIKDNISPILEVNVGVEVEEGCVVDFTETIDITIGNEVAEDDVAENDVFE